jgi:excisionase family DNA binding protein
MQRKDDMLELLKMAVESVMSDEKEFFTVNEIAAQLRVNAKTVIRWIQTGYLPGMRVGKHYRISRASYEEFLRRRSEEYQPSDDQDT